MALFFIAPWIQLIGVCIPLLGCVALFRKEQTKTTMSLLLTNIGCLFINSIYLLMLGAGNADAAYMANKILYLANTLFYFSFLLFVGTYLNFGTQRVRTVALSFWAGIEMLFLFLIFIGDPLHLVFAQIKIEVYKEAGITLVQTIPSVLYMVRNCILCLTLVTCMIVTTVRMFRVKALEERYNLARLCGAQFVIVVSLHVQLLSKIPYDIVPISSALSILAIILGVIRGNFFYVTDRGRDWVVEHTDNVLIITDKHYGYLDANPAAKKLFPELALLEKSQTIPKQVIELFYDYSFCIEIENRHYTKEVEKITQKNRTIGYSLLLIDDTEHHELLEQIEDEKNRAEEANKAKTAFMSNMSHEIRTPMNAIVGMTDILLREELPDNTREYLHNIRSSGDALLTIINDILDFSKIEAGKMDIVEDEYEPMSSLHDLSMIFLNRIGEKDVELLYDIDENLPEKLFGDRLRIRQVIINLMNNAIKFTEKGFVKLTVKAEKRDADIIELTYLIQDSGQGIKEEEVGQLFGTYQQVDKEKNHFKEGTGLGLAISKQLVELMGGTIGVRSVYGEGSTFYFTIPQKIRSEKMAASVKPQQKDEITVSGKFINPMIEEQYQKLVETYGIKTIPFEKVWSREEKASIVFTDDTEMLTIDMCAKMNSCSTQLCVLHNPMKQNLSDKKAILLNKPFYSLNFCQIVNGEVLQVEKDDEVNCFTAPDAKILLVDDHEMNLKVAKGLLEPLQLQVETAEDGKMALEMIQKECYDLVLMDHMMPIMDGVEATKTVKELEGEYYKTLPIIALSANATVEARELFRQNGFVDFVPKPIKIKELYGCIRKWLPAEKLRFEEVDTQKKTENAEEPFSIEGLDTKEGVLNSGGKEMYISLLGDFYKLIDQKAEKVESLLGNGMLREYTIEVHALKSTARMIGALELSEKFYELEQLGNMQDQKTLEQKTPGVLSLYRSYKPLLESFGKMKEQEKQEVPLEEIISALETLKQAIDSFDLDAADEAMHMLEGFSFPETCQRKVETLSAYVADVAMEDVMNLADVLINDLQK